MNRAVFLLLAFALPEAPQAAKLRKAGPNSNGWCYATIGPGKDWCWTNVDGKDGYYNEQTGKYACSSWETFDSDTFCKGSYEKKMAAHKANKHRRGSHSPWANYLESLGGKTSLNWKEACQKANLSPNSYSMSASGAKTTFSLTCGGKPISIVCSATSYGQPFKGCTSRFIPSTSSSSSSGSGSSNSGSGSSSPSSSSAGSKPSGNYNVKVGGKCQAGGFTSTEVQALLDMHNKMRCVAGAPPVKWSKDIECQAQKTQTQIGAFKHSQSYSLPISVGENLASGSSGATASWMWFSELLQTTRYGGSESGHYTAMVWKGVTEMGCAKGNDVIRCQYKGTPAPNMRGSYASNAPVFKGTTSDFKRCKLSSSDLKAKAKQFKSWGILNVNDKIWKRIGLYSVFDGLDFDEDDWTLNLAALTGCVFAGVVAMGVVFFAARLWRRRGDATTMMEDERELLALEVAE